MDKVIYIDVAKAIILKRISGRIVCPVCKVSYHIETRKPLVEGICDNDGAALIRRPDDSPEKVAVRLEAYEADTKPLIDFYSNKQGFIRIEEASELDGETVYKIIEEELSK
jgi:adenylate kinase